MAFFWRFIGIVIKNVFAKTPGSKARTLVRAGLTSDEEHVSQRNHTLTSTTSYKLTV